MLARVKLPHQLKALLAAAGIVLLASGCGNPIPVAADPFARVHAIVQAWWPQHESAFISGDPASLAALYGGPGLDEAQGEMMMAKLKGALPKYPRPFRGSVIFAPSGLTWFLAIVQYAPIDQDGRAEAITMTFPGLLFTDVSGAWKAIAANVQAPIPHAAFGSGDATLSSPLSDDRYIMAAPAIAPSYSAYLNTLSSGQESEVPFPTGIISFASEATRLTWPPGSIATARSSFAVLATAAAVYSITTGLTRVPEIAIFLLRRSILIKPRQGCLVRRAGDQWSDIVPAGSYSAVTLDSVLVVAASVPLSNGDTSQGRKVIDISGSVNDVSATTTRC